MKKAGKPKSNHSKPKKQKKIPGQPDTVIHSFFENERKRYLPPRIKYKPMISDGEQQKVLDLLKANTERGNFFYILNALNGKVTHAFGIKKWLGYEDDSFAQELFLNITHPSHLIPQWLNGTTVWDGMKLNPQWVSFYNNMMVVSVALKHKEGHYIYCRCESFTFQYTKEKEGIEFGYEFSIVKDHKEEDYSALLIDKNGRRPDIEATFIALKKQKFINSGLFRKRLLDVILAYAACSNATAKIVAAQLQLSQSTIEGYNSEIGHKAKAIFHQNFTDIRAVVKHLQLMEVV